MKSHSLEIFAALMLIVAKAVAAAASGAHAGMQPLSMIMIHRALEEIDSSAAIHASPTLLGLQNVDVDWVDVRVHNPKPAGDDWVGVFSPAEFNASTCATEPGNNREEAPLTCSAPIKYQFANYLNSEYTQTGKNNLKFQLINQRADFSFALFKGGLANPKVIAISNVVSFENPKAPLYPRLALGKSWDEMTITWTSGYDTKESVPLVEWGRKGGPLTQSPAVTLTFSRSDMCGSPARTFGWRHPGYIYTSFLKDLWPYTEYTYKIGHLIPNETYIWSKLYSFRSSPYPGQSSPPQRVIIFGDMGKAERDGSNEYANYQPGALNTTDQLVKDLDNIDIVFHIGDLSYSNGYLSQWDQFTSQVEPIASSVPYMVASGNHERDWPDSGSFYNTMDSGGECGVPAETLFYVPAEDKAKYWYSADYGMFRFCIADTEHDWRIGSEQYMFIERCLATANRHKQPWLIFAAHRVLGYSSDFWYAREGSFAEPMGREHIEPLLQKYRVDIAFYGHVHHYERTCQIFQSQCVSNERSQFSGTMKGTIHVVVGGGGSHLSNFTNVETSWSLFKDYDYGFVKMTAVNNSFLVFDYIKSSNGRVYDSFTIHREYKDVLACVHGSCQPTTLAI